jgi:hypothetical protein
MDRTKGNLQARPLGRLALSMRVDPARWPCAWGLRVGLARWRVRWSVRCLARWLALDASFGGHPPRLPPSCTVQVNTVLTELERHEGLCILATNRPMDLDEAMHRMP